MKGKVKKWVGNQRNSIEEHRKGKNGRTLGETVLGTVLMNIAKPG